MGGRGIWKLDNFAAVSCRISGAGSWNLAKCSVENLGPSHDTMIPATIYHVSQW